MPKTTSALVIAAASVLAITHLQAQGQGQFVVFGDSADLPAQTKEQAFVAPVTSPYFHEDSFITSDLRGWYAYHDFPASGAIGEGDAQIAALQIRLALTENLQFVAYKDGYADWDTPVVNGDGLNDLAAGVKWQFFRDDETQLFAAAGIGYQLAIGDDEVLQDDEELRLWASINKGFDKLHLGATVNYLIHTGSETPGLGSSDRFLWHLHADYYVNEWFSPVVEFNGYHTVSEGDNPALSVSGVDVANLGGGKDNPVVTLGLGAAFRLVDWMDLRVAYETPITNKDDLFGYRWTASIVIPF